jgi:hypothetical protein
VPPPPPGYLEGLFDELCRLTEERQERRKESLVAAAAAAAAAEVAPRNLELYMACLAAGDAAATAATAEAVAAATVEAAVITAAAAAEQLARANHRRLSVGWTQKAIHTTACLGAAGRDE